MALAVLFHQAPSEDVDLTKFSYDFAYEKWLYENNLYSSNLDADTNRYKNRNATNAEDVVKVNTESEFLFNTVKVVCLVFSKDINATWAVNNTWANHCNYVRFYHPRLEEKGIPIRKLPSSSSFGLLCSSLRQIVQELPQFDWVLVATEDTYVILENLRYYVAPMNSSAEFYLGHAMRFWNVVYNWGDAGYAISKGTVNKLLSKFSTKSLCESGGKYWKNGDWYLGKHLHQLGINPIDTRDEFGKGRFNGYSFRKLLFPGAVSIFERYWKDSLYLSPDGPKCCSNRAITFHGVLSTSKMYQLEYLFYHLRPFYAGGKYGNVAPAGPSRQSHLTWEEQRKEEEMEKMFNMMLTTPRSMLLMPLHYHEDDVTGSKDKHSH